MENLTGDANEAIQANNFELINNREDSVSAPLREAMNTNSLNFLDVASEYSGVNENATVYRRRGPLKRRSNEEESEPLLVKLMKPDFDITTMTKRECETLLHLSVKNGRINVAHLLIEKGVDINARDADGMTALHLAVLYHQYDAACMLLYYGASVEIKSKEKETPFMLALKNQSYYKFAELLFDYIINFGTTNLSRKSILYFALRLQNPLTQEIIARCNVESIVACLNPSPRTYLLDTHENSYVFKYLFTRINHAKLVRKYVTALDDLMSADNISEVDYLECFYLILSSDYAQKFVEKCTLLPLIEKLSMYKTNLSDRMGCLYSLLSLGIDITFIEFVYIYNHFGFNEELEAIFETRPTIKMQPHLRNPRDAVSIVNIFLYSSYGDMRDAHNILVDSNDKDYLKFFAHVYHFKEKYYRIGTTQRVNEDSVPSLREVSRDAIRKAIISSKLTQGCMYKVYAAIKTLPVPKIIQDILHLKRPLYM